MRVVRAAAAGCGRNGLRDSGALRGRAGAAAVDGAPGRALSGAAPRRSQPGCLPAPATGQARGHPEPAGGVVGSAAGDVQALRRAHHSRNLRDRSRHPGGPVLLRTATRAAGPVLGVSSNQDEPGGQPQHHPGEPLLSLRLPELHRNPQASTAGLPAAEVGSRPPLPGHRRVPLPKERPGQRSLPAARLLSPGLHPPLGGGPAGRPHVGGPALRPPQGRTGSATIRRQGVVRQARLRLLAGSGAGPVAALQVEPGRNGARRPALPGAGLGAHGAELAGGRGALRQAGHQQPRGLVCSESGIGILHEDFQPPGGRRGLQLAPDLHGFGRKNPLGSHLCDGAALQQQLPADT